MHFYVFSINLASRSLHFQYTFKHFLQICLVFKTFLFIFASFSIHFYIFSINSLYFQHSFTNFLPIFWPCCFSPLSTTGAKTTENELLNFDFLHFRPQAPGSAKMDSRSSIFSIYNHRRQDKRNWAAEAPFSAFSTTGARISENGFQKLHFQHFRPQAPGSAKWIREARFSAFRPQATGSAKLSPEVQFSTFSTGSAKMGSKNLIFSYLVPRRQDQRNWISEVWFSILSGTSARITVAWADRLTHGSDLKTREHRRQNTNKIQMTSRCLLAQPQGSFTIWSTMHCAWICAGRH